MNDLNLKYFLLGGLLIGMVTLVWVAVSAKSSTVSRDRLNSLNPDAQPSKSALTSLSNRLAAVIEQRIGGQNGSLAQKMDIAQIKRPPQEYVILSAVAALVLAAILMLVMGPFGFVLGLAGGLGGSYAFLTFMMGRTRRRFQNQLDENLTVMAGSLRAGYSLMQALAALASDDGEQPSRDEFARVINQTRLGRSVSDALDETSARMQSEDFGWVAQAIAINREVGGNLANVLDGVAHTIRERGALRRQVKALAAEGKMSAWILGLLPVLLAVVVSFVRPGYLNAFFTSGFLGYAVFGMAICSMAIGVFTMSKMIKIKF